MAATIMSHQGGTFPYFKLIGQELGGDTPQSVEYLLSTLKALG